MHPRPLRTRISDHLTIAPVLSDRPVPPGTSVLLVITDLEIGGVPLHLARLARSLRNAGLRVTVVSLVPPGPVARRLAADGIPVRSARAAHRLDLLAVLRLARILRQTRPALVHAFLFHANLAARLAAAIIGFPARRLLCEIQTVEIERRWHLALEALTCRLSRCTIANSPSVAAHLHRHARIPLSRLVCIPGGIDLDDFDARAAEHSARLPVLPDRPLFVWVGRFDPIKRLDVLLDAFARARPRIGGHLVLIGDGPLRESIRAHAARAGIAPHVTFAGLRDDVPAWLTRADVFVFPSAAEGMPNALLEAMAAALPIITTDAPGCRDLIQHERTGLLVPPGDSRAVADAMLRLATDPPLARRLGHAARREIQRAYRLDLCHARYLSLYAHALAPPAPA